MKALVVIFVLAFNATAGAAQQSKSNCAATAENVALQMYRGTSTGQYPLLSSTVRASFDENSDLVFEAQISNRIFTEQSHVVETVRYKLVAKGSEEACEILSATKLAN